MTAPSYLAGSLRSLWRNWLEYRIPHWDALEQEVAGTLRGTRSASVRVGWNGTERVQAEWHATLFTLTSETRDPDRTLAAARALKPVGVVLHHVLSQEPHPDAIVPVNSRAEDLCTLVDRALEARRTLSALETDPRVGVRSRERLRRRTESVVADAREEVERAVTAGLCARDGFFLIPPMVLGPEMISDWVAYRIALGLRAALAAPGGDEPPWRPVGVAVCRACTVVFVPRRRATGEFCSLCRKRPAQPFVLGQRPFEPGSRQTVRAPKLAGSMVVGWKTVTIGHCSECDAVFTGRRDATACSVCANRVRQRRHRRRETSAPPV